MSRWGALESAIVEHLRVGGEVRGGNVPGLSGVKTLEAAASPEWAAETSRGFPAVFVVWAGFDVTNPSQTIGQKPQPQGRCRFLIQCWATSGAESGGARLGENGAYALLDQVRDLLVGWVPPPQANEPQHPLLLSSEAVLEFEGGAVVLQATYEMNMTIRMA